MSPGNDLTNRMQLFIVFFMKSFKSTDHVFPDLLKVLLWK